MSDRRLAYQLLGPFDVRCEGRSIAPAGAKRRGLLAMLLLADGAVVTVEQLVDGLWGDEPPRSATNVVQAFVSQWRKVLEPKTRSAVRPERLVTSAGGYLLRTGGDDNDLRTFEQHLRAGRVAVADGATPAAVERLHAAVLQWRGAPLADLADLPFHLPAAARLEQLRTAAVEEWAGAALTTGEHAGVVEVLSAARAGTPLRERLTELLMWALYAGGRQAEALAVYEETRRRLADDLGVDPGAALRSMHARILRHDVRLVPSRPPRRRPSLPAAGDPFFGRAEELSALPALLDAHRIVTIIGPGGSGKTRLALEVAAARVGAGHEVAFVDATPLVESASLAERLLAALDARPVGGTSAAEALAAVLRDRAVLAVLDNLEHLPGAAAAVADIVRASPGVRVLATSRVALHVRGERVFPLRPLPVPPQRGAADDAPGWRSPALELFVERVAAADARFLLSSNTLPVSAEICRRLDGLPLAIEIAASWVPVLGPVGLLERLDQALGLLHQTGADRPARHLSLRATIAWSDQLLDDASQAAFRRVAVFRGPFPPEAAAAVLGAFDACDEVTVLRRLADLADKSLLEVSGRETGGPRFRMLETVREYALERLETAGEAHECRAAHARWMEVLVQECAPALTGADQETPLDRLQGFRDDIAAALSWLAGTDPARGLRVVAQLWRFWHLRRGLDEGRRLVERLLAAAPEDAPPADVVRGLVALGSMAYWQHDLAAARPAYERARQLAAAAGDDVLLAEAEHNLAFVVAASGDLAGGTALFRAARDRYETAGDRAGWARAQEGLALLEHLGGRQENARALVSESLATFREVGDRHAAHNALTLLGSVLRLEGAMAEAESALRDAVTAQCRSGNVSGVAWALRELAAVALTRGDAGRAVLLSSCAETLAEDAGTDAPIELMRLADVSAAARTRLPAARVIDLEQAARSLTLQQAVDVAVGARTLP